MDTRKKADIFTFIESNKFAAKSDRTLEPDFLRKICQQLKDSNNNDPKLLVGACIYINELIRREYPKGNPPEIYKIKLMSFFEKEIGPHLFWNLENKLIELQCACESVKLTYLGHFYHHMVKTDESFVATNFKEFIDKLPQHGNANYHTSQNLKTKLLDDIVEALIVVKKRDEAEFNMLKGGLPDLNLLVQKIAKLSIEYEDKKKEQNKNDTDNANTNRQALLKFGEFFLKTWQQHLTKQYSNNQSKQSRTPEESLNKYLKERSIVLGFVLFCLLNTKINSYTASNSILYNLCLFILNKEKIEDISLSEQREWLGALSTFLQKIKDKHGNTNELEAFILEINIYLGQICEQLTKSTTTEYIIKAGEYAVQYGTSLAFTKITQQSMLNIFSALVGVNFGPIAPVVYNAIGVIAFSRLPVGSLVQNKVVTSATHKLFDNPASKAVGNFFDRHLHKNFSKFFNDPSVEAHQKEFLVEYIENILNLPYPAITNEEKRRVNYVIGNSLDLYRSAEFIPAAQYCSKTPSTKCS